MSKATYVPDRGDIVLVNFMPSAGREIDKRRPAVVLSAKAYNKLSGLCVAVPITSQTSKGPMWITLPEGLLPRSGMVLCDQIRSLDWRERSAESIGRVPADLMEEITVRVLELVDPVFK